MANPRTGGGWLGRGSRRRIALDLPHDERDGAGGPMWALPPALAAFVLCFLLMTWPWVVGLVTIPWDAKAHFQPQIQFLADSISRGEWPWWNPFVFSGQPQVADPQSMIFSPPFLVLALVSRSPSLWAADMTVLAAMAAGGAGMIVYFRDRRWHPAGALIAAIVFSFGAAMAWRIQHTGQVLSLAYLPWALVALERSVARGSYAAGIGLGLVAAMIVLGRDQVALLCIYLLAGRVLWLWCAAEDRARAVKASLLPLTAGGLVAVLIVAVPVLMTAVLAADSNRPAIDFEGAGRGSLHPALLVTFVLPQLFGPAGHMADYWGPPSFAWQDTGLFIAQNVGILYVGAIPLLVMAGAAATGRLWRPDVRFFAIAWVVMMLYALGWYTPAFRAMHALLPGVGLYRRPADAVFLIGALSAVLAGYAVHRLFERPWREVPLAAVVAGGAPTVAALAVALLAGAAIGRLDRIGGPLLGGAIAFGAGALAIGWCLDRIALTPWRAALGLAVITSADLAWNNGPTTSSALPPSFYEVLEPGTKNATIRLLKDNVISGAERRDRVELAGLGFHWPNASMTHRLENTLGYNPVRLDLYSRATGAEDHVGLPDQRKFSLLMPSYRSPLADMLGLRFIATGAAIETIDRSVGPADLRLVAETADGHFVYENVRALPRVVLATEAREADFDRILATGIWPDGLDPRREVLLGEKAASPSGRRPGHARVLAYANSDVVVEADSPDGGHVVLFDVWHPWWRAEVDGAPARIERANVLFRAVAVPAGRNVVRFRFRPLDGLLGDLMRRR